MNQNPEQLARDKVDEQLLLSGWIIQNKKSINLHAGIGVAVREYLTDVGPADYVLFVDKKPVGLIEAKRKEEGVHLTVHEDQSKQYADSKLKYLHNDPLPFVYESTGEITHFTDYRDPKPRSRTVFTFHRPETFREWLKQEKTLRGRLHDLPALNTAGLRDCQVTAINNLERSFKAAKPKALIQMATGSGKTVDRNFQQWILKKNAKQHNQFFEEQMAWLKRIKEHIASSFHLEREDLEYTPFHINGCLGKMWQLFGERMAGIINELNEELAA